MYQRIYKDATKIETIDRLKIIAIIAHRNLKLYSIIMLLKLQIRLRKMKFETKFGMIMCLLAGTALVCVMIFL